DGLPGSFVLGFPYIHPGSQPLMRRRSPEAHSVKVVFTSRLAGLSPRIRLRSLVDFWPTKFTFALRLKSSDESLRPIRCSRHPTQRKRHLPPRWPRRHTLSLTMNQSG